MKVIALTKAENANKEKEKWKERKKRKVPKDVGWDLGPMCQWLCRRRQRTLKTKTNKPKKDRKKERKEKSRMLAYSICISIQTYGICISHYLDKGRERKKTKKKKKRWKARKKRKVF